MVFSFSLKVFLYLLASQLYYFIHRAIRINYAQEKRELIIVGSLFEIVEYIALKSSLHRSENAI